LDDLGQPYSCSQWGNAHEVDNPIVIDGQSCFECNNTYPVFNWLGTYWTDYAFIDHNMVIYHLQTDIYSNLANTIISDMLNALPLIGDINDDSLLNILDLVGIVNIILSGDYEEIADYNQDGQVNILDLVQITNYIISTS